MLIRGINVSVFYLSILCSTSSLATLLLDEVLSLNYKAMVPLNPIGTVSNDMLLEPLLYPSSLLTGIGKNFMNTDLMDQDNFTCINKSILLGMGDDDPPKKPEFNSDCDGCLESISLDDLLNLLRWLLEQINSGNLQAQDCVVELLNSLSSQISLGQSETPQFHGYLSLFVNLIRQNRVLFEMVREWFDA